ncbi:MAG: hypothetical protein ABIG32_02055 [Candidatus Uhrbacteria bacterium]|nr:hypothetical protein [Patescibacteria group bacterium]MBU1906616.1 hypothetical protein [Patescibacteria group bacterium]
MKKIYLLILAIILIMFVGVMISMFRGPKRVEPVVYDTSLQEEPLIGGQTDDWGCLGPAGYGYDDGVGACIRVWELDEGARRAAAIAVAQVGWSEGLTVVEAEAVQCEGCYEVRLDIGAEFPKDRVTLSLENWEVVGMVTNE